MRKWLYLTLLALSAAAPAKQATINTIVTANSADPAKKAIINTLPITNSAAQTVYGCARTSKPTIPCDAIAAQAAIEQARDADWQAYAAAAGVIVGALTLLAAVAAAIFAKRAADETKRTADIAEANAEDTVQALQIAAQANAEAKYIGDLQNRAYVGTIGAALFYPDQQPIAVIDFKNHGNTPAKEVVVEASLKYSTENISKVLSHDTQTYIGTLDPGFTSNVTIVNKPAIGLHGKAIESMLRRAENLHLYVDIRYETLGNLHARSIVYYVDKNAIQLDPNKTMMQVGKFGQQGE